MSLPQTPQAGNGWHRMIFQSVWRGALPQPPESNFAKPWQGCPGLEEVFSHPGFHHPNMEVV
eukprot:4407409-Alexandrium_andersonii.AAC.1